MTFFFEMSHCIFKVGIYLENFYPKGNSAMCYSSASTYIFGTIKNPPSGCQNICPSKKLNYVVGSCSSSGSMAFSVHLLAGLTATITFRVMPDPLANDRQ